MLRGICRCPRGAWRKFFKIPCPSRCDGVPAHGRADAKTNMHFTWAIFVDEEPSADTSGARLSKLVRIVSPCACPCLDICICTRMPAHRGHSGM